jgi:hypothetical protein
MGIAMSQASLTGAWAGAYRYPADAAPETVFDAALEERDGLLTGATREPDLRPTSRGGVVTADIEGRREGRNVRFVKYMDGSGGMRHAIVYEGELDAQGQRIEGRWTIPGEWSGSFFMTRESGAAEARDAATEAAPDSIAASAPTPGQ